MIIAVYAEVPLPGRCLRPLLPYNDEAWLARLSAAMLRDTLDGLENFPAERYLVLPREDVSDDDRKVLERHIPLPWELGTPRDLEQANLLDGGKGLIVARTEAPAADLQPLLELDATEPFALVGRSASGEPWLFGVRAECKDLIELPPAIVVTTQPELDALCEELRQHHERAPRTALLAMT